MCEYARNKDPTRKRTNTLDARGSAIATLGAMLTQIRHHRNIPT